MEYFANSLVVACGASVIAVTLASYLALATFGRNTVAARCQAGLIGCFLLLPSYVVAGAWSAGFGSVGWWTLSQVTSAKAPLVGIASVVWIHAMAALPVAYWILVIGLSKCRSTPIQLARCEGGLLRQFRLGIWPNWSSWIVGTFLSIAAWISGDMVVTNLFQVPTLVEQCYLDMIADQVHFRRILAASSLSLLFGSIGMGVVSYAWSKVRPVRSHELHSDFIIGHHWAFSVAAWLIVSVSVLLPLANLLIKAGWVARQNGRGNIERSWSLVNAMRNCVHAPSSFYREFQWSLSLSTWSATIACFFGAVAVLAIFPPAVEKCGSRSGAKRLVYQLVRAILIGFCIGCFSLPGPIVNLLVIRFYQAPIIGLQWLCDHTLAAPILCMQFRLIPLAVLVFAIFHRRWQEESGQTWAIDAGRPWSAKIRLCMLSFAKPVAILWLALLAVAMGDLATYLQCLPPGVTTISMRIFDLLHYGVRASEAGLLLLLVLVGALAGWLATRILTR